MSAKNEHTSTVVDELESLTIEEILAGAVSNKRAEALLLNRTAEDIRHDNLARRHHYPYIKRGPHHQKE